jgi:hypothetical protein
MKVFLEPYETEAAIQVGTKRYLMRLDSGDRAYYDRSRMEHDLHANIAACVAEIAVAKHLNQYWGNHWWVASGHKLYESMADVGYDVEVRRIREPRNPVAIRDKDVFNDRTIYAVYVKTPEYTEADIIGSISAKRGWEMGSRPEWDKKDESRVVSLDQLDRLDT